MARVIWTEPALQDLDAIADIISLDKPLAAKRFVQRVFERIDQLADHPGSGSLPRELRGLSYRQFVVLPVRIFCRQENESVFIIHVRRGEKLFRHEGLHERDMARP